MEFIQSSLCMNNLKDDLDDEVLQSVLSMSHPREALVKAKVLKEEGNKEFRKGNIRKAADFYNSAIQFAAVGLPSTDEEGSMMTDLAVSINLNLAACCLKVGDFNMCINFCSYVMKFDVQNPKALYRRAKAYIGLQLWEEALKDLKQGVQIDPKNKDIALSLTTVEEMLGNMNSAVYKGKGKLREDLHVEDMQCDTECQAESSRTSVSHIKGKDVAEVSYSTGYPSNSCSFLKKHQNPINELKIDGVKPMEVDVHDVVTTKEAGGGNKFDPLGLKKEKVQSPIKVSFSITDLRDLSSSVDKNDINPSTSITPESSPCMTESKGRVSGALNLDSTVEGVPAQVATPPFVSTHRAGGGADPSSIKSPAGDLPSNCTHFGDKSGYRFFQKGQPTHSLKISPATYDKLLSGDSCEFYDNHGMRHMVVRIHRPEPPKTGAEKFSDTTKLNPKSDIRHKDERNIQDDGESPNAKSSLPPSPVVLQVQPSDDMEIDSGTAVCEKRYAPEKVITIPVATPEGTEPTLSFHNGLFTGLCKNFNSKNRGVNTRTRSLRRKKMNRRTSAIINGRQQPVGDPNRREYDRSLGLKSKRTMFDPGDFVRRSKIHVMSIGATGSCIHPVYRKEVVKGKIKRYFRYSVRLASLVT